MSMRRLAVILLLAAGAVVFLLAGIDEDTVELAWGFVLTTCGLIVERLD